MKDARSLFLLGVMALLALYGCSDDGTADGGGSGDTTAPTLTGSYPADGATEVSRSGPYWFAFSEEMDVESVQDNISASPDFGHDIHANAEADTFWLTPHTALAGNTAYEFNIGPACSDIAGNEMGTVISIDFVTTAVQDMDPPVVLGTDPANGATGVSCGEVLRITFNEPVTYPGDWGTQTAIVIDPWPEDGYFEREGDDLLVWHYPFPTDSLIEVTVTTDLTDIAGNHLDGPYSFSFRTLEDDTRPFLASASPSNGETGVSPDIPYISITFSEPMFPEFYMPPENVDARIMLALSGEPHWDAEFTTVTLPLERGLLTGCTYWVYFEDVTDMALNYIDPNPTHYWFRTLGTPSYYPRNEGDLWYYFSSGIILRNMPGLDFGTERRVIENHNPGTGEFEEVWYVWDDGAWVLREKTFLRDAGSELMHLGREEYRDGVLNQRMIWDEPLTYLKLPPQTNLGDYWTIAATADLGEGATLSLEGDITISGTTVDVYVPFAESIFADCIEWILHVQTTFYDDGTPLPSDEFRQKFYLSEGVGLVMIVDEDLNTFSEPDTTIVSGWDID